MAGVRGWLVAVVLAGFALAGCMKTSRIDEGVTPATLASAKRAVALMRVGSASPACVHTRVQLGRRVPQGFKPSQIITVTNLRSATMSQVAEVELEAGEHHIVGYSCIADKGTTYVSDPIGGQFLGTSFAHFTLQPGEIVNVGYFHFGASRDGRSLFGRAIRTDVEITDWPLAEIERFRQQRPAVFAQMTTRLMRTDEVLPPDEQAKVCATWQALKADGKAAEVPPECGGAVTTVKRTRGKT